MKKFCKKFEYKIFTIQEFNKPDKYILCFRKLKKNWIQLFFKMNKWEELGENGTSGIYKKKTFITESIDEINEFMEWVIKKNN